jgi:hypothetical protein
MHSVAYVAWEIVCSIPVGPYFGSSLAWEKVA